MVEKFRHLFKQACKPIKLGIKQINVILSLLIQSEASHGLNCKGNNNLEVISNLYKINHIIISITHLLHFDLHDQFDKDIIQNFCLVLKMASSFQTIQLYNILASINLYQRDDINFPSCKLGKIKNYKLLILISLIENLHFIDKCFNFLSAPPVLSCLYQSK